MQKTKSKSEPETANGKPAASVLQTPSDLKQADRQKVADAINAIVADSFVLYFKTKNFHWHVSGPNFRDYHLMLDEQADQIFASIDPLAERVRKLGLPTLHSLAHVLNLTALQENSEEVVSPGAMLDELCADNVACAKAMREAHKLCDDAEDVATASLLEVYIDETEKRTWFLFESARNADRGGH